MRYILCDFNINTNIFINGQSNEYIFTNIVLHDIPYSAKIKNKTANICYFKKALIPILSDFVPESEYQKLSEYCIRHLTKKFQANDAVLVNALYDYFSKYETEYSYVCDIIGIIEDGAFDMFYSDGSSSLKENIGAYGTVKLLEENSSGYYDDLTGKNFNIKSFSGGITDGTNNIGELSGIKTAVDNYGEKKIQIITSDSEYAIKCFREWYYSWEKSNFVASNGKEIKNKELIKNTMNSIRNSKKIYLFRWVKGHKDNVLNEFCDNLAKEALKNMRT